MRAILATTPLDPGQAASATAALGSAVAAIATLTLVSWAAIRFRGVLPALGAGIAIQIAVLSLGGFELVQSLPWFLPSTLAGGGSASLLGVGLSTLLFAGGLALSIRELRRVDLYE
jgi:NhaP-type Na+/H+ or K+/H+ antiporter